MNVERKEVIKDERWGEREIEGKIGRKNENLKSKRKYHFTICSSKNE